jgi:molybdopterin synthase catalytic subunit
MTVTVRLFAFYADRIGRSELKVDLPPGSRVSQVVKTISALPGASVIPSSPLIAVNCEYTRDDLCLNDGDEIALIPPVAGG